MPRVILLLDQYVKSDLLGYRTWVERRYLRRLGLWLLATAPMVPVMLRVSFLVALVAVATCKALRYHHRHNGCQHEQHGKLKIVLLDYWMSKRIMKVFH